MYVEDIQRKRGRAPLTIGIETISAYAVGIFLILVIINFMLRSARRMTVIIVNTLFGGALFIILNILGMKLTVNAVSIALVSLLGIPGVILVVIMKFVLGVWQWKKI